MRGAGDVLASVSKPCYFLRAVRSARQPMTWMNRSGIAVRALRDSLECEPSEILVCYNGLAPPAGTNPAAPERLARRSQRHALDHRPVGGGTTEFPRLRNGIAPESGAVEDGGEFVLSPFRRERPLVEEVVSR